MAWHVLIVTPMAELEVERQLKLACAARGWVLATQVPLVTRLGARGVVLRTPVLRGYLFVRLASELLPALKGLVDQVQGFINVAGKPFTPAVVSDAVLTDFLAELAKHNNHVVAPPAKTLVVGARVSLLGPLVGTVVKAGPRDALVAVQLLGRLIDVSVSQGTPCRP